MKCLIKGGKSQNYADTVAQYLRIVLSIPTCVDIVQLMVIRAPFYNRHSMLAMDRLGRPECIEIPIAIAFGA